MLKSTDDFIEELKEFNPNSQNTMVSFDVVSLFTNVPLVETIDIIINRLYDENQRWSPRGRPWPRGRPRGQILKSLALALASKVKSLALALASRPQVLENWPVLGSRTALFFGKLKFCGAVEKFFGKRFFVEIA